MIRMERIEPSSWTYWKTAHRRYFERQGKFSPDMLLYCERFRLIEQIDFQRLVPEHS
jgi:uncharacterized protein YhfF